MSRLPPVAYEELAPADRAMWDRIAAVRGGATQGGTMRGPFSVLIRVPALAERVAAVEDYFRFDAELRAADRELVILTAVREVGARFPWCRHEMRANQEGTRPEAIEVVRAKDGLDGLTDRERLLVGTVRSLLRNHGLSQDEFGRGEAGLGRRQLIEVVVLTGQYNLVGLVANSFAVESPEDHPGF